MHTKVWVKKDRGHEHMKDCKKYFIIYTNPHKDINLEVTCRIEKFFAQKGVVTDRILGSDSAKFPGEVQEAGIDWENADGMLVLGGDGTMLHAAGLGKGRIPLVGVNMGTLGYMAEIELSGLEQALERLAGGDYILENRMMLQGSVFSAAGTFAENWALNDIVISRSGSLQILKFNIYVNGQLLHDYQADGVIITTATGSTGYNLSAGGPIVEPKANLILLTPICPHTLNQRSIILSPEDEIDIEISQGRDGNRQMVEASFDGGNAITLQTGDKIHIVRAEKTTRFIRLSQVSFLEALHRKLRES